MKNRLKSAYTLAEIIIVLLIVAVIVSISIKITKVKLNNITSYAYYSAYNTVRAVSAEMVKDFDASNEDYNVSEANVAYKIKHFFATNFGFLQASAAISTVNCNCPTGWLCNSVTGACVNPDTNDNGNLTPDTGYTLVEDIPFNDNVAGTVGCALAACLNGKRLDTNLCKCVDDTTTDSSSSGSSVCPDVIPCGQECNASTGFQLQNISGFSRVCDSVNKQWSETACGCIPSVSTVPRSGEGYCKLFVGYSNTSQITGYDECSGTSRISLDDTDFSEKVPDIKLRNGMLLYNVKQEPAYIQELSGNSKGSTYTDSNGNIIDVDETGYTIYVDIDGAKNGTNKLWQDVFRFYITLSGNVIPAYDADSPQSAGGDSIAHLQTSVYDEYIDANGRRIEWVTKSKSFKDSACAMGYVNAETPYCKGEPASSGKAQCTQQSHDCRLKTVMPVKFFGRS